MVQYKFNRELYVTTETVEGTPNVGTTADIVDTYDDVTYTLEPTSIERNLVRPGFTQIPQYHPGDGITTSDTPVTKVTFTIRVELNATKEDAAAGNRDAASGGSANWERLLLACGMQKFSTVRKIGISSGPSAGAPLLNRENLSVSSTVFGRAVSTHFPGDSEVFYTLSGSDPVSTNTIDGDVGGGSATASGSSSAVGYAYALSTAAGSGNGSSAYIVLYADGHKVAARGCRGNCSIELNANQVAIATFTMEGILHEYDETQAILNTLTVDTAPTPPIVNNLGLSMIATASGTTSFTGADFESITIDFGNEVQLRTNANDADGWSAARIVGRDPILTINPDAIQGGSVGASTYPFFEHFVRGLFARAAFTLGTQDSGNAFTFKAPFLQWDGIADGDRDSYAVIDGTCKLTGGDLGDSVLTSDGSKRYYTDRGYDNELVIVFN